MTQFNQRLQQVQLQFMMSIKRIPSMVSVSLLELGLMMEFGKWETMERFPLLQQTKLLFQIAMQLQMEKLQALFTAET